MLSEQNFKTLVSHIGENLQKVENRNDLIQFINWLEPYKGLLEQLNRIEELEQSQKFKIDADLLEIPTTSASIESSESEISHELIQPEQTLVTETLEETTKEQEPMEELPQPKTEVVEPSSMIGKEFVFIQYINGGILEGLNYRITENLAYRLQLKNGYRLRILEHIGTFSDGTPRYMFEVSDKTVLFDNRIKVVEQAIVEVENNRYFISRTIAAPIRHKGKQVKLYLREKDIERYHINEGAIINGRFYTNNLASFTVTWRYYTNSVNTVTPIEKARLLQRQNQKKKDSTHIGPSMLDRINKTLLIGKKMVIVGLESRMNDFKNILAHPNNENLNIVHLTGDEREAVLRSEVKNADVVLLSTKENSHDATISAAAICKDYDVPVTSTDADGLYSLLLCAIGLLERSERLIN
ncbi:MAG: DUF2325 domain-containing protein [Kurthia sp.]|nr:DUF2325 domain-containing protein [Candidatus Kurthia equi]